MSQVSAFIIFYNEAATLKRALDSLSFASEIILVDSGSTDKSLEIIKNYPTAKYYTRNWTGFKDQKNFALQQCQHKWIFSIDADEMVSPELQQKVLDITSRESDGGITCYRVRREEYFLGKHLTGGPGNPSFQERLFQKGAVEYIGRIHEYPKVIKGNYGLIQEPIHHNPAFGIEKFLDKMNRYTTIEAQDRIAEGRRSNLWHAFGTFFSTFLKNYVSYKGFKNGKEGLILCYLEALSRSVRHFKVWAMQRQLK